MLPGTAYRLRPASQFTSQRSQHMVQRKERKRLDMLDALKSRCGPFTDSGEVEKFLKDNVKQQRMKLEVQFARESTTLLPKVDLIFESR